MEVAIFFSCHLWQNGRENSSFQNFFLEEQNNQKNVSKPATPFLQFHLNAYNVIKVSIQPVRNLLNQSHTTQYTLHRTKEILILPHYTLGVNTPLHHQEGQDT